ncbi:uncharacterized protein GGS25DRAFT_200777 [Hypoxylon fragiforme]|uniref:uncharacterized protein n=1 Tax=Hypoxylon fragiforme TaxID=63214 RepID=UPI0020C732B1|nr:uncharacterized protein GGS25DRAFT_200777 [Hypoxylon fragiforme]KAI2611543.1 hypothetical protein GGS25DRAFT_200777 [Hypoxylon fragiforme]
MKSEFMAWWQSQTAHPSSLRPSVPICPCAACFNGTGHGEEVFSNPIDPGEVLPLKRDKKNTTSSPISKPQEDKLKTPQSKKPWYKQASSSLVRKPSSASMASDSVPLCSAAASTTTTTQTIRRMSSETLSEEDGKEARQEEERFRSDTVQHVGNFASVYW